MSTKIKREDLTEDYVWDDEQGQWKVDGYPYIHLRREVFEERGWDENYINMIGKLVCNEVHRNTLHENNKILIIVRDNPKTENNSSEQTIIEEEE